MDPEVLIRSAPEDGYFHAFCSIATDEKSMTERTTLSSLTGGYSIINIDQIFERM